VFALGCLNILAVRVALFEMDCFGQHAKKHAVLQSRAAHLGTEFVRCVTSPALVGIGIGLKHVVQASAVSVLIADSEHFNNVLLLSASNGVSMLSFVMIYHLHRTAYFHSFSIRNFFYGLVLSCTFIIIPFTSTTYVEATGSCFAIWVISILVQDATEDLYSFKDDDDTTEFPNDVKSAKDLIKFFQVQNVVTQVKSLFSNMMS
jgi:hypothetical protein